MRNKFLAVFTAFPIFFIRVCYCQLHDASSSSLVTPPSWAPTGRLHQFNGFASPRPSLLPQNAQMVYASVWAAWSAWSFCADGKRIRVRACNTVRGFRCLGSNQETEACDPSTSPFRGLPRPNSIANDYDVIDPWQEDRIEALKQLYPDESIDEKLSRLPEHEKQRLLSRVGELTAQPTPPTPLISHDLLNRRPSNDGRTGAPGSTPEKLFGARAFAVKSFNDRDGKPLMLLPDDGDSFGDYKNIFDDGDHELKNQPIDIDDEFVPFLERDGDTSTSAERIKTRGEGTFTLPKEKNRGESKPSQQQRQPESETESETESEFNMDPPKFQGADFTSDVFGVIEEFTSTTKPTTTTTTSTTPATTTVRRLPTRVTPRPPSTVAIDENFELVTPEFISVTRPPPPTVPPTVATVTQPPPPTVPPTVATVTQPPPPTVPPTVATVTQPPPPTVPPTVATVTQPPPPTVSRVSPVTQSTATVTPSAKNFEILNFFEDQEIIMPQEELPVTTRKPYKHAIHEGDVSATISRPIPEEISFDTLHALDWMLANMTKAAEEGEASNDFSGNDLVRLDSSIEQNLKTNLETKKLIKKRPKKTKKLPRNRNKLTKIIKLHYGEAEPTLVRKKFPKSRNLRAHRAKIYGIKTANSKEIKFPLTQFSTDPLQQKKNELIEEISDIQDLMEQLDEKTESRSALMESTPTSFPISKHMHNAPTFHRSRLAAAV